MAPPAKAKAKPKWVIDLHGVLEALTTRGNERAIVIDAIANGEMLVMRSVQHELKDVDEELWDDFVAIKGKKYVDTTVAISAIAAQLQETNGSSVLGAVPSFAHFEAVALARKLKLKLVSAGKGLSDCLDIAANCGLPVADILDLKSV